MILVQDNGGRVWPVKKVNKQLIDYLCLLKKNVKKKPLKFYLNQRFGNPTGSISSTTIDFGVILATESTSAMSTPA